VQPHAAEIPSLQLSVSGTVNCLMMLTVIKNEQQQKMVIMSKNIKTFSRTDY
jgi:hypothetical protein